MAHLGGDSIKHVNKRAWQWRVSINIIVNVLWAEHQQRGIVTSIGII